MPGVRYGRVATEYQQLYRLYTEDGEMWGSLSGKWRNAATERADLPAVGDFVAFTRAQGDERAILHGLVPRRSCFSRKAAGGGMQEQIIAANVDFVCLVMAQNRDFNLRRLERYLTAIWESGAHPVIILSKTDLCDEPNVYLREAQTAAQGAEIIAVSAVLGVGLDPLRALLRDGPYARTAVFTGASGAGKSTLINALLDSPTMKVQAVRADDDRGRHTTTHRELLFLPGGGLIIDTPGMRELGLWGTGDGLEGSFSDITELATSCRYRDCRHEKEPGCAVQGALQSGTLTLERFTHYGKLQRELAYLSRQDDVRAQIAAQKKWKALTVEARRKGKRP